MKQEANSPPADD